MTHDELLAKIDQELICYCGHADLCDGITSKEQAPSWFALRAVVELHTPTKEGECKECRAVTDCSECYGIEFVEAPYPCPTIKSIEKEL